MNYKLDLKDRKILYELNLDSSQTNTEIAKKVGLSKHSVGYRISKMVDVGVILRFHCVVDIKKLGYYYYRLHIKTKKDNKKLIEYLLKHPFIHWASLCEGKYNLMAGFMAKNIEHFYEIYREITGVFRNEIKDLDFVIVIEAPEFDRAYLLDKNQSALISKKVAGKNEKIEVDRIDRKILNELSMNARIDKARLAKKLGLTYAVIRYRIKQLENKKIITGYGVDIDQNKIGYEFYKLLLYLSNFTEDDEKKLLNFCKLHPNVYHFISCLGKWNAEINIEAKNNEHYRKIVSELNEKFPELITDFETLIINKVLIENYFPAGLAD